MKTFDARLQHVANVLTIGTGFAYGWAKYFAPPANAYSNVSAWEPPARVSHVLVVTLLVYACGYIWRNHVIPMWRKSSTRPKAQAASGLGLIFVLLPMIATGYLIQVTVEESWRKAWVIVHLVTSAAWILSYLTHFLMRNQQLSYEQVSILRD